MTGGCRSSWLTAGPPGRSFTASAATASVAAARREPAERPGQGLSSSSSCCHVSFDVVLQALSCRRLAARRRAAPQRRAQLVGQRAAQLGPHEAADRDAPALARELDQRAVAVRRLDPHPGGARTRPARCAGRACIRRSAGPAQRSCVRGRPHGARRRASAAPSASSSSPANGSTRVAPWHQNAPAMPSDHGAQRQVDAEQLARRRSSSCASAPTAPSRRRRRRAGCRSAARRGRRRGPREGLNAES